ncbi:IS66 family transposase [Paenibacillus donghaensis]|uniref:IS66 family transposase n=1 Tax=Paenibacillus donghaensis TaxID=414771 RepID=UPI001FE786F2|nr:IS66 family transposase [Paenibacillus donghaensis]
MKRKPQNNRTPGGKKGAPKGHPGQTLKFSSTPDETLTHPLTVCPDCQTSLADVPSATYQSRQVFEMPEPRIHITEHRVEQKRCPCCHKKQQASFPEGVRAYVQYGPRLTAFSAYLHGYQLLPLARLSELLHVLTGCKPSERTLLGQIEATSGTLSPYIEQIREAVLGSPVIHSDETGARVQQKEKWVHVNSTPEWTLLGVATSRGSEGMKTLRVLDTYQGTVVHDCYGSYFKQDTFAFDHALCNAHLMRECKGIALYDKQKWASEMLDFLKGSWQMEEQARLTNRRLSQETIRQLEERYDEILGQSQEELANVPIPAKTGPRGRKSNSKAGNLAARFIKHKEAMLKFLHNPEVPFDNNQAERDLRMVVVKQKISGCFRTSDSPEWFAAIRSFISTLTKQGRPVLASLVQASSGSFSFTPDEGPK